MTAHATAHDHALLERAYDIALAHERSGGLPVGAVLALDGEIIAEGHSITPGEGYHPGHHAETAALAAVDPRLWEMATRMTLATTLEPCMMCFGACLLHGVGRVVFGASDPLGGAHHVRPHLPPYYGRNGGPVWVGPVDPPRFDPLYARTHAMFEALPCAQLSSRADQSSASPGPHPRAG